MIVDAHHHVWRLARGDYGWLTPDLPIHRDYGIDDLRPLLGDIAATILVQAAATEAETAFLLDVARGSAGLVRGVVGWTDLAAPDAADAVAALAAEKPLVGVRPMLQDIVDTGWILGPAVQPGLAAMARAGLRLDLLIQPRHLALVPELARRHPGLALVIDHGAKPDIAGGSFDAWAGGIAAASRETGAFCKLSGLVTEAGPSWNGADLRRYVDHLLDCFGPDRLMWGSDWPVVDLAGGFLVWREAARALVPQAAHEAVFGGTAARFYGLGSGRGRATGDEMILASCHCGAVELEIAVGPEEVTDCNCSICRRYGVLWAYYAPSQVRFTKPGATDTYMWDDKAIRFHRCRVCGCVSHWSAVDASVARMGINARLMDLEVVGRARVRRLDGAVTERYVDE